MGEVVDFDQSTGVGHGLTWDNLTGQQVGRFLVQSRLGSGGVAIVYQAYDQVAGRTVALKVLPPNSETGTRDRFRREALMAGALRHPNIVQVYQVGANAAGGLAYIAMELVEGESLADLLGRSHALQAEESCNVLAPIAQALAHAHGQGVVHRDVKPSNILLKPARPGAPHSVQLQSIDYPVVPVLTDFGVARYLDAPELTNAGRTVGTPAFMAPEQCAGSRTIDGRADIYALGTVLYRCVAGRLPFAGSTTQVMHAQVYEPVLIDDRVLHSLPPEVVQLLRRSLAKRPEDRYSDAVEMAEMLAHAAGRARAAWPDSAGTEAATATLSIVDAVGSGTLANAVPGTSSVLVPSAGALAPTPQPGPGAAKEFEEGSVRTLGANRWSALAGAILLAGAVIFWAMFGSRFGAADEPLAVERQPERSSASAAASPLPSAMPTTAGAVTPTEPALSPVQVQAVGVEAVDQASATDTPVIDEAMPTEAAESTVEAPAAEPSPATAETPAPIAPTPATTEAPVVATPVAGGDEGVALACTDVVDEFFVQTLMNLDEMTRKQFACPSDRSAATMGVYMPFQSGVMLHLDESPVIYVYYIRTGEWEQAVLRGGSGPSVEAPETEPLPPGQFLPDGAFAEVWTPPQRRTVLGNATAPTAISFRAIVQAFPGGILVGNSDDGTVYVLERSKLRL